VPIDSLLLEGLSLSLGVFPKVVRRVEQSATEPYPALTGDERLALRREMTDAVRAAALAGTKQSALGLARAIDRRLAGWIGLAVGAAFVLGCAATLAICIFGGVGRYSSDVQIAAAWHDLQLANPDPRAALAQSQIAVERESGRPYCSCVAFWAAPAPPPKTR
jgi:hypothetical protein